MEMDVQTVDGKALVPYPLNVDCYMALSDAYALPCHGQVEMFDGVLVVRGEHASSPHWKDRPRVFFDGCSVPTAPLSDEALKILFAKGLLPADEVRLEEGVPVAASSSVEGTP